MSLVKQTSEVAKLPPHALELEPVVLGAIIGFSEALSRCIDLLRADMFHDPAHRIIYDMILRIHAKGKGIDLMTVVQGLKDAGRLEDVGGALYISQLTNKVASTKHVEHHVRILAEKYMLRELIAVGAGTIQHAYDDRDPFELIDVLSTRCTDLLNIGQSHHLGTAADEITALMDKMEVKYLRFSTPGLRDKAIFQSGLPHVFAGRPGIGKSIFSVEECWAWTERGDVLLFSPEMTKRQVTARILARECGVPYSIILMGQMDEQQTELVTQTGLRIADRLTRLKIDPTSGVTPDQVRTRTERAAKQFNLIAVAVDHLHKMKTGDKAIDRDMGACVTRCMNGLTEVAKAMDLPFLVMAQLNREVEKRPDKRPSMADLKWSGDIEQDAALVGLMYRAGYYEADPPYEDVLEINLAKNRDGAVGLCEAPIIPALSRIGTSTPLSHGHPGF